MFIGNLDEIKDEIGNLGIGALPFITIGTPWYIYNCSKKYEKAMNEQHETEQPLRDLGLAYFPPGRLAKKGHLWVSGTREDLNVEDFM
jgi:hypothetical protein